MNWKCKNSKHIEPCPWKVKVNIGDVDKTWTKLELKNHYGPAWAWEIIGEDWQMIGWTSGFEIIRVGNGHRESLDGLQSLGKSWGWLGELLAWKSFGWESLEGLESLGKSRRMIGLKTIRVDTGRHARPIAVHQASVCECQKGWNAILTWAPPRIKVLLFDGLGVGKSLATTCHWECNSYL